MRSDISSEKPIATFRNQHLSAAMTANKIFRSAGFYYDRHCHEDLFQLIVVTDGDLSYRGESSYQLSKGDIILTPPGIFHDLYTENGYTQFGINLTPSALSDKERYQTFIALFQHEFFCHAPELLSSVNEAMKRIGDYADISAHILQSYADVILYAVADRFRITVSSGIGKGLSDFLDLHLDTPQTLASIADAFSLSASHLERLCHQDYGIGVMAFYNRKRFDAACSQLIFTEKSIDEISQMLGFSYCSVFSAFFKKYAGISPLAYRRTHKSE